MHLEAWNPPKNSFFDPSENRYWRTHHTFCQAYLQDLSTGAATLPQVGGTSLGGVGPREEPWVGA